MSESNSKLDKKPKAKQTTSAYWCTQCFSPHGPIIEGTSFTLKVCKYCEDD